MQQVDSFVAPIHLCEKREYTGSTYADQGYGNKWLWMDILTMRAQLWKFAVHTISCPVRQVYSCVFKEIPISYVHLRLITYLFVVSLLILEKTLHFVCSMGCYKRLTGTNYENESMWKRGRGSLLCRNKENYFCSFRMMSNITFNLHCLFYITIILVFKHITT